MRLQAQLAHKLAIVIRNDHPRDRLPTESTGRHAQKTCDDLVFSDGENNIPIANVARQTARCRYRRDHRARSNSAAVGIRWRW